MQSFARNFLLLSFSMSCVGCCPESVMAESLTQSQTPMAKVARDYSWQPVRADILPQRQKVNAGEPVPVRIVLLDASGRLTNAVEKTDLVVDMANHSDQGVSILVEIARGASSVVLNLPSMRPGLNKLTVRHPRNRVLESSNFVLITPSLGRQPEVNETTEALGLQATRTESSPVGNAASKRSADMVVYEHSSGEGPSSGPITGSLRPALMLKISGEGDANVRADDASYGRIGVYYMGREPARFPLQVWLTWNRGEVQPNPIVIQKGEYFAEAHWTSAASVAGAKVAIADIKPAIAVAGSREATMNFIEPVAGVALVNPPDTISIVDVPKLHARFYDLAGNFIKTSDKRNITVSTNNAIIRFNPNSQDTDWDFETDLIPNGLGRAEIEVTTPGYPAFKHTIVITYLSIVWLCVIGGLLGGLTDVLMKTPRGRLVPVRLIVGVVAAVLVLWAYVAIAIPQVTLGVLHSRIAVVAVSLIGGWAGIMIFRKAGRIAGVEF